MKFILNEIIMSFEKLYEDLIAEVNPNHEQELHSVYVKYLLNTLISEEQINKLFEDFLILANQYISLKVFTALLKSVSIIKSGAEITLETLKQPYKPPVLPTIFGNMTDFNLTEEEINEFANLFTAFEPVNGLLDGKKLRIFSLNTGLSQELLYNIWTHVDPDGDGLINQTEFYVYLKLIKIVKKGSTFPLRLPQQLLKYLRLGPNSPNQNIAPKKGCVQSINDLIQIPPDFVPDTHEQSLIDAIQKNIQENKSVLQQIDDQNVINLELEKTLNNLLSMLEEKKQNYKEIRKQELEIVAKHEKVKAEVNYL